MKMLCRRFRLPRAAEFFYRGLDDNERAWAQCRSTVNRQNSLLIPYGGIKAKAETALQVQR
jgi:hypothetical protein